MKYQFNKGKFWRYDVIVKYMFIELYFKNGKPDDLSFDLYDKLYKGISKTKRIKSEDFAPLILSFEEKGYDEEWPISVGRNGKYICGGSHRLACCLWFDIGKIPIETHPKCKRKPDRFSGHWMRNHGLREAMPEIKLVKRKIFDKLGI